MTSGPGSLSGHSSGSRDRRRWRRRGGCPTCCACHSVPGGKSESPSDGTFAVPAAHRRARWPGEFPCLRCGLGWRAAGIGEGGGDEEDVRLVVRAIPSRVASRNLRATERFHEKHRIVRFFLGRPPPAGAALRILRSSLGRAGIGEGGGDEEDVRLVVRTIPSRVASRNLRATEPSPSRRCAACQGCAAREPTSRPHPIQELDRADVLHDFLHGSRPVGRFLGEHLPDQL